MPTTPSEPAPLRPYRERWPEILRYPLHPAALSTIAAIAVAHLVDFLPGVGGLLDLVVWAAFFKYAFEVLRWTANGRSEPPEISFTVSDSIATWAVLLLIAAEFLIAVIASAYGAAIGFALGVGLMLAMPAVMIALALEEEIAQALNPLAWLLLAERIGRSYFVLAGFFATAVALQSVVAAWLSSMLPAFVAEPLVYAVVNYLMIAN
ncbi:MAG TPA: hypothetical protein VFB32_09960, partial [Rudaea sp.]|nr:hypothetical protein [Rudaea sp.]